MLMKCCTAGTRFSRALFQCGHRNKGRALGEELQVRSPCSKPFRKPIAPACGLEWLMLRDMEFGSVSLGWSLGGICEVTPGASSK